MKSLVIAFVLLAGVAQAQKEVALVVSSNASPVEKLAATELASHLRVLYPSTRFSVGDRTGEGPSVLLGTPASSPGLARYLTDKKIEGPKGFVVTTVPAQRVPMAVIAAAEPRGTLFAVYALLEKLGFGFYLSYNTQPLARQGPFTFDGWALADHPLASRRLVFNWHNFLSGCSAWNLEDWQLWITQAARMRFNGIMVHAYGNNPMFAFTHNGLKKPTGYLSTTLRGRDWGTEHVLDVRKIIGGAGLFNGSVFGSSAGLVPESETVQAATGLMRKAFEFAAGRGLGVTFAIDVDTESTNPKNIISSLPSTARFSAHGVQLANPETPEGRKYYRSQVQQLLETYPQITEIAIWFRGGKNSPWRGLQPQDFPAAWQEEYRQALQSRRDLRADPEAPSLFAIGKIAAVFRGILDETGHKQTLLATGSWNFDFLRAADAFMPAGLALIPLDYAYAFPSDPVQEAVRAVSRHRPVIPVVWAQHDDRGYAGRPYMPFPGFASLLRGTGSAGYGIIHWTTRPLDLYFKNLSAQVWRASENEQLVTTCALMAERTFGAPARKAGTEYLLDWIQDAPMFGRETTDSFIDQRLDEVLVFDGCRRRLELLERLTPLAKSPAASTWVSYFKDWERFVVEFYRVHSAWQRSVAAVQSGSTGQARDALAGVAPERVMEQYARTIAHGGATPGEKGILISLNLRWLPYFVSQRQALGMEPLRIRFAPTAPEPLAQLPGRATFAFDSEHHLWQVLGTTEVGADVLPAGSGASCSGGLQVNHPISLSLGPIGKQPLPPGNQKLKVELNPAGVLEISDGGVRRVQSGTESVPVTVAGGRLDLTFRPVNGAASVCGLVLEFAGRTPSAR